MIDTETREGMATVTLDRPQRRNALTPAGLVALRSAIEGAAAPVVYLRGQGDAFCAGADLDAIGALEDRDAAAAFATSGQAVGRAIEASEAVVVAGIDGPARGGGVDLALACDLRIATPAATVAATGVDLGLFGAWGGTARLPALVGLGDALDLALSGRTIDAAEARRLGLVSRVDATPRAVARSLADKPPRALATIKRRLRDPAEQLVKERREAAAFADLIATGADRD